MKNIIYVGFLSMGLISLNASAQIAAAMKPTICNFDSGEVQSASCHELVPVKDGCPKDFEAAGQYCVNVGTNEGPIEVLRHQCPENMSIMGSKCVAENVLPRVENK